MVKAAAAFTASAHSADQDPPVLDPRVVFEPLRLACRTRSNNLTITSLDCISKLVSYAFFAEDDPVQVASATIAAGQPPQTLADLVTETVCDCYHESLDDKVGPPDHQGAPRIRPLHRRPRPPVQPAQGRAHRLQHLPHEQVPRQPGHRSGQSHTDGPPRLCPRASRRTLGSGAISASDSTTDITQPRLNGRDSSDTHANDAAQPQDEKITLKTFENRKSFEGASERDNAGSLANMSTAELFVKDAFLVLRALCKLTMKPLGAESERDLKSHAMRSKLLSLHLILTIIQSHMAIFTDPTVIIHSTTTGEQTQFVQAVKQYLCLSLSRNAVSSVNQVFEISCEIFWLILDGMRTKLKKEIEVLLNEIFLPILEMRTSTPKQKSILLGVFIRLCQDPQALVEIYLNYDCDRTALDNIYERLMNVVSKISQAHVSANADARADKDAFPRPPRGRHCQDVRLRPRHPTVSKHSSRWRCLSRLCHVELWCQPVG